MADIEELKKEYLELSGKDKVPGTWKEKRLSEEIEKLKTPEEMKGNKTNLLADHHPMKEYSFKPGDGKKLGEDGLYHIYLAPHVNTRKKGSIMQPHVVKIHQMAYKKRVKVWERMQNPFAERTLLHDPTIK